MVDELARHVAASDWYLGGLRKLVQQLEDMKLVSATPVRLGSMMSIKMRVDGKTRSKLLPLDLAAACISGTTGAVYTIIFGFLPVYEIATVVRIKVGIDQSPSARTIEGMLLADARAAAGAHLAALGALLAARVGAACARSGDEEAAHAAKRKIAVDKARRHVQRAVNAGISREDLLAIYDEMIATKLKA